MSNLPLLLAEGAVRTTFEWGRIQSNRDWILPVLACLAIMFFVRQLYRRDAAELPRGWSWLLTTLRTATFYGLLLLYLQPQWRVEREITRDSKVLLLADTSLSMSLANDPSIVSSPSRAEAMVAALAKSPLLQELRKTHEVSIARFDQEVKRLAALPKIQPEDSSSQTQPASTAAVADETTSASTMRNGKAPPWSDLLAPTGSETRLGQALRQVLQEEQSTPLAGVVLLSDGGQNAGPGPENAVQAARDAKVPLFAIGLGSDHRPAEVRVSDLVAPPRAYPGDRYTVTGYVQAQGLSGQTATVELLSRAAGKEGAAARAEPQHLEGSQQVQLGADGEMLPVKFEIVPERTGLRTLTLRVRSPRADPKSTQSQREVDVEVVDHKTKVLLLASGPSREYQFLRSLLFRDRSIVVDVLLQTGREGMSQEANKVLDEFPATREALFAYDCLIALDPDWQALSAASIDLVEKWIGEQAGGAIFAAGPVEAGKSINGWTQDPAMGKIRALYPVEFQRNLALIESNAYLSKDPWPLDFTREGIEAEFLWLGDDAAASQQTWSQFAGVYSYFPVRGPKPGATVLARFSDPQSGQSGRQPVYFSSQFYGSGRVFYMASAEMWRLRRVEESNFERFYTKLIRHVTQGRLLRGSSRGVLLVGQDRGYRVGSSVDIRAQLTNKQLEPLVAASVPVVVVSPSGVRRTVNLAGDPARAGNFLGHFTALEEGTYRLELPIPDSDEQRLVRRVQVELPQAELKDPQRNDALLSRLARQTGGHYFVGTRAAVEPASPTALWKLLKDRTQTVVLTAAPNPLWERQWLRTMMLVLCGLLCLEWLLRRLLKLA